MSSFELYNLFSKEDEGGEGEDSHAHQQHEEAQLLVGLGTQISIVRLSLYL
jgi:hypothetical protein